MHFSAPTARLDDGLFLPENPSLFTRLKVGVRALRVLEKKPDDTVAAPVLNASIDGDVFFLLCAELASTDDGRALLAARPSLQASNLDLPALKRLPPGIMGREFADYFERNRIAPFESPYEVRNDTDFLVKWYRETHDLHHVITGYTTDALGEMELQAFMAANLGLRTSLLILTFAAVLTPHGLPPIWRYWGKLKAAWRRGKASKRVITLRYEQLLETPVAEVQRLLSLPATA